MLVYFELNAVPDHCRMILRQYKVKEVTCLNQLLFVIASSPESVRCLWLRQLGFSAVSEWSRIPRWNWRTNLAEKYFLRSCDCPEGFAALLHDKNPDRSDFLTENCVCCSSMLSHGTTALFRLPSPPGRITHHILVALGIGTTLHPWGTDPSKLDTAHCSE